MQIGGISPTIKATYYKIGLSDLLSRQDGYSRPGIIEIYESSNRMGTR